MKYQDTISLALVCLLSMSSADSVIITVKNNCPYPVWPATLSNAGQPQLSKTGFYLGPDASSDIYVPGLWSGRLWARTHCSSDETGKFSCATGDCGSGQVECNGGGGIPPASLVEISLADGRQDFYDLSLVDGFNIPLSIAPKDVQGSEDCEMLSCAADMNVICPSALSVKGEDGRVIACRSACLAFNRPQYCCTGDYGSPDKCGATYYSNIFKQQCPRAYSYAYDDKFTIFTCSGGLDYDVEFCPDEAMD